MSETWFVRTPEYDVVEDIIDGYRLLGRVRDWTDVQACSAREARIQAVNGWLRDRDSYCSQRKADSLSPYGGIEAEREADVKAREHATAPTVPPTDCWSCGLYVDDHVGPIVWEWRDDANEWGWFGSCAVGRLAATQEGQQ